MHQFQNLMSLPQQTAFQPQAAPATPAQNSGQTGLARVLWVGIGCQRQTPKAVLEWAIQQVLQTYQLPEEAVAGIATIALKADETGLVELCQERGWLFRTFSADVLRQVTVPTPSFVISQKIATPSVAEAAALQAAKVQQLLVPKQIYRFPISQAINPQKKGLGITIALAKTQAIDSCLNES